MQPDIPLHTTCLAGCQFLLGLISVAEGASTDAEEHLSRAVGLLDGLARHGKAEPDDMLMLANSLTMLAGVLDGLNNTDTAIEAASRAVLIAEALAQRGAFATPGDELDISVLALGRVWLVEPHDDGS